MLVNHSLVFLLLLVLAFLYFRLAIKFGIVDHPNQRSSHSQITVRGGGILFPLALVIWWASHDFAHTWMITGLLLISFISFLDDINSLSRSLRLGIQTLALSFAFYDLGVFEKVDWIGLPVLYFVSLGIINAVNFMDGINGITGVYALIFSGTLLAINKFNPIFEESMVYNLVLAILVFLIFNFRKKALMFAGDIGSISLAFLLIYFLVEWYLVSESWTIVLMLSIYGVDVCYTLFERWRRGEKLSEPHRSHLYQILANQGKLSHVGISIGYAFLQTLVNFYFFIIPQSVPGSIPALLFLTALAFVYIGVKLPLKKKYKLP